MTELQKVLKNNKDIFWDIPEGKMDNLSQKVILERFLNYGKSMKDVLTVIEILGTYNAKDLFFKLIEQPRSSIRPETKNYFTKYFYSYAR